MSIGCDTCAPTGARWSKSTNVSIALEVAESRARQRKAAAHGVDRVPAVIVSAPDCDRIRYYGPPLGNELPL